MFQQSMNYCLLSVFCSDVSNQSDVIFKLPWLSRVAGRFLHDGQVRVNEAISFALRFIGFCLLCYAIESYLSS